MKQLHLWPPTTLPRPLAARSRFRRSRAFWRHDAVSRLRFRTSDRAPGLDWTDPAQGPQDRWYAIEDLLLRLASRLPVHALLAEGHWRITLAGIQVHEDSEVRVLAAVAADKSTFTWRSACQRGCFARSIFIDGSDVEIALASLASMARWPQGVDIAWQVTAFMSRLRAQSGPKRRSTGRRYVADLRRRLRASCSTTCATSSPPSSSSAPAMRSSKASDG